MKRVFTTTMLTAAASLTLMAGSANAATIVWDFNDNNGIVDANGLSSDGVTTDTATATHVGNTVASFSSSRAQRDLGNDNGESATFSFTINIGATPTDLTGLSFVNGLDVNAGSVTTNYWKWDLAITTTGSETPVSTQTTFAKFHDNGTGPNEISFNESATLSGLTNLSNVSVTFEFTGLYGTAPDYSGGQNTNRFIYIDDLTFTGGAAVPEPGSLALMGLGGLCVLRRRRG